MAHLPYADLRMGFPGKKTVVGVFGKKNMLIGVPPFLDKALEPARERLRAAAKGTGKIEDALTVRAMRDALKLQLAGTAQTVALLRIYPLGLAPQTAGEILATMRLALNRITRGARGIAAAFCIFIGGGIFAGMFLTPLHGQITQGWQPMMEPAFDAGLLIAVLTACWCALSTASRFVLQRRFPTMTIPLTQTTGKPAMRRWPLWPPFSRLFFSWLRVKPDWLQRLFYS